MKLFVTFGVLLLLSCPTRGLVWGFWDVTRTNGATWVLPTGSQFDEARRSMFFGLGAYINFVGTSRMTEEYLSTVNVFFTSLLIDTASPLDTVEKGILEDWVRYSGGVLVMSCYGSYLTVCKNYLELFDLDLNVSGYGLPASLSNCSGDHQLLNGVEEIQQNYPQYLVINDTKVTQLCTDSEGRTTIGLLKYGHGYVLFSEAHGFHDGYFLEYDNKIFAENLILWTEQLECGNHDGCPEYILRPGECSFDCLSCETACSVIVCNSENDCVSGSTIDCNDNDICTQNSCDPQEGCITESIECDDKIDCTVDFCDSSYGCLHQGQEECYPTITHTSEKITELQVVVEEIKNHLLSPSEPPTLTLPPLLHVPSTEQSPPAEEIPLADVVTDVVTNVMNDFIEISSQNMQQFMEEQSHQVEGINERIDGLETQITAIRDKIDKLITCWSPSETTTPTSAPTLIPTSVPTEEPIHCKASNNLTRSDFITSICFSSSQECLADEICTQVSNESSCDIPLDVLMSSDYCWGTAGYILPEDLDEIDGTSESGSGDSDIMNFPEQISYDAWNSLAQCIQRACDCVSESGKWSFTTTLSMTLSTSLFECCLLCHETNCVKWQFQESFCILLDNSATLDDSAASLVWTRGQIQ